MLHSLDALLPAVPAATGDGPGQKETPVAAVQLPGRSPQVNTLYGGIGPQKLLPACTNDGMVTATFLPPAAAFCVGSVAYTVKPRALHPN